MPKIRSMKLSVRVKVAELRQYTPDMVRASTKALLSTQRQPTCIHQIAKELPACGNLKYLLPFGFGNSEIKSRNAEVDLNR